MPNPFSENIDIDDDDRSAEDRDIEKLRKAAQEGSGERAEPRSVQDQFEDVVVDLSSDDDPDSDEDRPSRKGKKQNRFREALERADAAEERARRIEAQMAALEQRLSSQQQYSPGIQTEDPSEKELREIRARQKDLRNLYAARYASKDMSQEEGDRYNSEFEDLENRATEVVVSRKLQEHLSSQKGNDLNQMLQIKYMDLAYNPQARSSALGLYTMKVADGARPGPELLEEVADETYRKYKIGPYKKGISPSSGAKAKLSGNPTGGTGGRSSGNNKLKKIVMTRELRRMADAMYPHLEPKERYETWAKNVGSKALEEIDQKNT
jgi:hypothetical protein